MGDRSAAADVTALVIAYLPQYLRDALSLALDRKSFFAEQTTGASSSCLNSAYFLASSVALGVLVLWFLVGMTVADSVLLWIITMATLIWTLFLLSVKIDSLWRRAGAKPAARVYFTTYAYFAGWAFIGMLGNVLVAYGIASAINRWRPGLYADVWNAYVGAAPSMPDGFLIALAPVVIFLYGGMWLSPWHSDMWAAFRQMHGLTRTRSALVRIGFSSVVWLSTTIEAGVVYLGLCFAALALS